MGVPVIASRVAGCVGMLGDDYPGLFPVGDTTALANLVLSGGTRCGFYADCVRLAIGCDHYFARSAEARPRGDRCFKIAEPLAA